jgi:hypothetical protein
MPAPSPPIEARAAVADANAANADAVHARCAACAFA